MKAPNLLFSGVCGFIVACAASTYLGWDNGIHNRALTRVEATNIAARLASGKLRSARLDRDEGMPVWEFDFEQAGTMDFTEVCVHALTGEIVAKRSQSSRHVDKDLSRTAALLGITADHLPRIPDNAPTASPPTEELVPPKQPLLH